MATSRKNTLLFGSLAVTALLVGVALATLPRRTMPRDGQMTYAKYGCIPDDPSKREWDRNLGLSACK